VPGSPAWLVLQALRRCASPPSWRAGSDSPAGLVIKIKVPVQSEKRAEIECTTLSIVCSGHNTVITVRLDEGFSSEREVTWEYGEDHPTFIFRRS
jgi:hypothetical protein